MDKSLLSKAAIQSVALMIAVVTLSYALNQYKTVTIEASNIISADTSCMDNSAYLEDLLVPIETTQTKAIILEQKNFLTEAELNATVTSLEDLTSRIDDTILQQLGDNYLVIRKPKASNMIVKLYDLYINKSVELVLTSDTQALLTSDMVYRIRDKEFYVGDPTYTEVISMETEEEDGTIKEVVTKDFGNDISYGITVSSQEGNRTNSFTTQINMELDKVYAYSLYEDANYYLVDLKNPSEVYDKIIVIDAGHGGKDAGALSKDKKYYEKDINLSILLHLKDLLDKENIKVYYTRVADDKVFLRPRVVLANSVDCDYFISIHCNANDVTGPNGTEVLYYNNDFKGVSAKALARIFSDDIAKTVTLKQRGTIEKHIEDIFIMDKAAVPMVLIEVGYLTNNNDITYLSHSENRKAVAQGIYNGIMRAYEELPVAE